jgi:cell division protein ZapD
MAIYEYPLNERSRVLLRLEYIFSRAQHYLPESTTWGTQAAIDSIVSCVNVFSRSDMKSELLKELERNLTTMRRLSKTAGVDVERLEHSILDLESAQRGLIQLTKPIGAELREDDFFKTIMQRSAIPGGTCAFDLPQFHLWLTQPAPKRIQSLEGWFKEFLPVRTTVNLLLSLYRSSYRFQELEIKQGNHQQSLDPSQTTQLVYIELADDLSIFPEVSGNKHRISIRFRHMDLATMAIDNADARINCKFALSIL